jgi:steroid Delta-isomerase
MSAMDRLDRLAGFFETLSPGTVARLPDHYDEAARFVDPFNDVTGHAAIARIFTDMFERLDAPRFVVTGRYAATGVTPEDEAMLRWEMRFRSRLLGEGEHVIEGTTRLCFGKDGRVVLHRDYWDAAGELYARLPILGLPIRAIARRLKAR